MGKKRAIQEDIKVGDVAIGFHTSELIAALCSIIYNEVPESSETDPVIFVPFCVIKSFSLEGWTIGVNCKERSFQEALIKNSYLAEKIEHGCKEYALQVAKRHKLSIELFGLEEN